MRLARATALRRERHGAIAVMVALLLPLLMALAALVTDAGLYIIGSTRLQIAADAAAMSTVMMLPNATFQATTASAKQTAMQNVAQFEAQAAATKLVGTMTLPPTVTADPSWSQYVTVTITSQPASFFRSLLGAASPLLKMTSKASLPGLVPCVLALGYAPYSSPTGIDQSDDGGAGTIGILADTGSIISAPTCEVFSNTVSTGTTSASVSSLYVNSGSITAKAIGARGNIYLSGGTVSPANSPGSNQAAMTDPLSSYAAPADPGTCDYGASITSTTIGTTLPTSLTSPSKTAGQWTTLCGNIGKFSTTTPLSFGPGIYFVVGGTLTLNVGTTVTFSSLGVSFVFLKRKSTLPIGLNMNATVAAGSSLIGYSGVTSNPTKIALWAPCDSVTPSTATALTFGAGTALNLSDAIYAPCGAVRTQANAAVAPTSGAALSVIAAVIHTVQTSGTTPSITAASLSSGSSSTTPALTQ